MKNLDKLMIWTWWQRVIILGTPLTLGILEMWHPVGLPNKTPFESVLPKVDWWITLHLLQLPLFGLLGLAVILLVHNLHGWAATLSRIGIAFFIVFYVALDSIMGIAGGLLIRSARDLSPNIQIFAANQFNLLLFEPIIGGSTFSLLGILGGGGWAIGVIAAAIALRRSGVPLLSFVFLLASAILFGLAHVPPTGPLGLACFFIAVVRIDPFLWGDKNIARHNRYNQEVLR
ncbi:hypothetical protein [Aphanothece sacrum]|uniref:Uncharacterized protein n=1 Tax=Aphanothece sacrum FPU1 TaxID=1920663 RepID=A0A401IN92_APHSA|nr:hypothetical protein [Aphanothece sacrum]GBF82730.1 hypothetical protein AsFPU1_4164 [Aphanothece sacrum FPU1]GBF84479.1 hypothetical protein AsFPU3_1528 [Aphanothece sacrum FPU3]